MAGRKPVRSRRYFPIRDRQLDRMPLLEALAELDPHARMAVVLTYYLDLPADAVAGILEDDGSALRSDLNDARNRLQSRVDEQRSFAGADPAAADAAAGTGAPQPFDARLRRALIEESARFRPILDPRALRLPSRRGEGLPRVVRRWWPLAVAAIVVRWSGRVLLARPGLGFGGWRHAKPRAGRRHSYLAPLPSQSRWPTARSRRRIRRSPSPAGRHSPRSTSTAAAPAWDSRSTR